MPKDETASKLEKSKSEVEFELVKHWVPRIAIWIFGVIIILYFSRYFGMPLGSSTDIGAFGDFVGGVLNPLLTFGTILLLIYSITFQLDELKETRNEIKESREEIKKSNKISTSNVKIQETIFRTERTIEELNNLFKLYKECLNFEIPSDHTREGSETKSPINVLKKTFNYGIYLVVPVPHCDFANLISRLTDLINMYNGKLDYIVSKNLERTLFETLISGFMLELSELGSHVTRFIQAEEYLEERDVKLFNELTDSIDKARNRSKKLLPP